MRHIFTFIIVVVGLFVLASYSGFIAHAQIPFPSVSPSGTPCVPPPTNTDCIATLMDPITCTYNVMCISATPSPTPTFDFTITPTPSPSPMVCVPPSVLAGCIATLMDSSTCTYFTMCTSATPSPMPTVDITITPTPIPTVNPTPSVTPTPTPTPSGDPYTTCDDTWDVTFQQTSGSAVRNGEVGFKISLPGLNYGHVMNNPSIADAYQYPHSTVRDPYIRITSVDAGTTQFGYEGYVYMKSADVALVKFDLWCSSTGDSYEVVKTFYWPLPVTVAPTPTPTPTGTVSDIRYVSFEISIDVDPAKASDGLILNSQVQLRNLKENL